MKFVGILVNKLDRWFCKVDLRQLKPGNTIYPYPRFAPGITGAAFCYYQVLHALEEGGDREMCSKVGSSQGLPLFIA